MPTLKEIVDSGISLVFLDADPIREKHIPSGMAIGCSRKFYKVYFQVNGSEDFEYVNSYPVYQYADPKNFEDILSGGLKLAKLILTDKVSL
jgi:hypothetical protein